MSSLWDIVKTVGSGIISTAVPGGPLIVAAINAALPDDQQLPEGATGAQAQDAISKIPAVDRAAVMDKQFEVQLTEIKESHDTVRTMLTADATMPQTTRPKIVLGMYRVVSFVIIVTISLWAYAVGMKDEVMVTAIMNGWPFVVGIIGPFLVVIRTYFGILKQEQQNKLDAAGGAVTAPSGIAGILSAVLKR